MSPSRERREPSTLRAGRIATDACSCTLVVPVFVLHMPSRILNVHSTNCKSVNLVLRHGRGNDSDLGRSVGLFSQTEAETPFYALIVPSLIFQGIIYFINYTQFEKISWVQILQHRCSYKLQN